VQKAVMWFVAARQCFSGVFGAPWARDKEPNRNGKGKTVQTYRSTIERLPEIHDRLKTVTVENGTFQKIIKDFDSPDTFFYLDPPYVPDTRVSKKVYQHEMSISDHEELVECLLKLKGKALLSGYPSPIYGALECAGWKRRDFPATCTISSRHKHENETAEERRKRSQRTECIWMNY
jgi:DNA adenine methylase